MSEDTLYLQRIRTAGKTVETSKTRPADTTTYAPGDIVNESTSAGTILTFANFARQAGKGALIVGAVLIDSIAQSLKPELELWLFDTSITVQNDNAAWAPTDSDMEKCLGVIDLSAGLFKTGSGNGVIVRDGLAMHCTCASGSTTLYGVLVVRNAYVPGNAEKLTVRLKVLQD